MTSTPTKALVLDIKDAIVDNISLGKSQAYHINNSLIPIYYTANKNSPDSKESTQALIIKTPRIFIPHVIYTRNSAQQTSSYLEIVFLNESADAGISNFKKWLKRVETRVVKILSRRKTISLVGKQFSSILKEDENYKSSKIYLTIQPDKTECLDTNNKPIANWNFIAPCYGFFVIQLKNIWMNATKWGINLYTQGAMVLPSQLCDPPAVSIRHLFDDELKVYMPVGDDERYGKYFRMMKMGVPLEAVKHKMMSAAPELIGTVMEYKPETLIINIPELNAKPVVSKLEGASGNKPNVSMSDVKKQILGAISLGVKLKSVGNSANPANLPNKKVLNNSNIRKDLMVPTLDEIRNALKNLKKKETL